MTRSLILSNYLDTFSESKTLFQIRCLDHQISLKQTNQVVLKEIDSF